MRRRLATNGRGTAICVEYQFRWVFAQAIYQNNTDNGWTGLGATGISNLMNIHDLETSVAQPSKNNADLLKLESVANTTFIQQYFASY